MKGHKFKFYGLFQFWLFQCIPYSQNKFLFGVIFEKIIFIADKIEPRTRPQTYIDYIKPHLKEKNGLDMALLACFKGTIKSLVDRDLKICISTIDIYNELLGKYEKNK